MGEVKRNVHGDLVMVTTDVAQSRVRDGAVMTSGTGQIRLAPPTGQYWLVDRVAAQCDAGGNAVLTVYDGDPSPANVVSAGRAGLGLSVVYGRFDVPVIVAPGTGLTLVISGNALPASSMGVWYRRQYVTPVAPGDDRDLAARPAPETLDSGAPLPPVDERVPDPVPPVIARPARGVDVPQGVGDVPPDPTYR